MNGSCQVYVCMDQNDTNLSKSSLRGKTVFVNIQDINEKKKFSDVNPTFKTKINI